MKFRRLLVGAILCFTIAVPLVLDKYQFNSESAKGQALEVLRKKKPEAKLTIMTLAMPSGWDHVFALGDPNGSEFIGIRPDGSITGLGFADIDAASKIFWKLVAKNYPQFIETACESQ